MDEIEVDFEVEFKANLSHHFCQDFELSTKIRYKVKVKKIDLTLKMIKTPSVIQ